MDTLGDFLKHGREEAGLSLDELAVRTRIRIENLRSLEREDLDSLPTDTYVRGFVRQVCRELGLEPTDGIVRYETLRRQSMPPDETTWAEEVVEEDPGFLERALRDPDRVVRLAGSAGKWAGLAAGAGALVVVAALLLRGGDGPEASEPVRAAAPRPARQVPVTAPAPAKSTQDPAKAVPEPVRKAPEPKAPEPAKTSQVVQQSAKAAPPSAPSAPARSPAVQTASGAGAAELRVLRLEALRPVEVSVLLDGTGHARRARLAAGETRTWKADGLFVLSASDGGAVRLYVDDQPIGTAGGDGEAVRGLRIRPR
jgi:cytoskeleton protein RodZ